MFRTLLVLFVTFGLITLAASFDVLAAPSYEPPYNSTTYDTTMPAAAEDPMQAHARQVLAEQAMAARQSAQTATNTNDIAQMQRMTGTQDFILKLTAIIMPLLIAMMTGLMLYIQIKQKAINEPYWIPP